MDWNYFIVFEQWNSMNKCVARLPLGIELTVGAASKNNEQILADFILIWSDLHLLRSVIVHRTVLLHLNHSGISRSFTPRLPCFDGSIWTFSMEFQLCQYQYPCGTLSLRLQVWFCLLHRPTIFRWKCFLESLLKRRGNRPFRRSTWRNSKQ